eukprot:363384-Chlamydomonas_euryale.AAC.2
MSVNVFGLKYAQCEVRAMCGRPSKHTASTHSLHPVRPPHPPASRLLMPSMQAGLHALAHKHEYAMGITKLALR